MFSCKESCLLCIFVYGNKFTSVIGYYWTFVIISGIMMIAVFQVIFHPCSEDVKDELLCEEYDKEDENINK